MSADESWRNQVLTVAPSDVLDGSLNAITNQDISINEYVSAQPTATNPVFDYGCWINDLAAQGVAQNRARFAKLHAAQSDGTDGKLGIQEAIQSDAPSHHIPASE